MVIKNRHIKESLLPYTDANLNFTFRSALFYKELALKSGKAESSLKNALVNAKKVNLIQLTGGKFVFNKQAVILVERYKNLMLYRLKAVT